MPNSQGGPEIERLIQAFAKLPGLGPRSARRAVLHLIKKKETLMQPLAQALGVAIEKVGICSVCGNIDTANPCGICQDPSRAALPLCVVEDVSDLWALERAGAHQGRYHVIGGTLSAMDGIGPEDLNISSLIERVEKLDVPEVILALNATVDGQTTANYIMDLLGDKSVSVTRLAQGVPMGGELNYLDDGTLAAAMKSRRPVTD